MTIKKIIITIIIDNAFSLFDYLVTSDLCWEKIEQTGDIPPAREGHSLV